MTIKAALATGCMVVSAAAWASPKGRPESKTVDAEAGAVCVEAARPVATIGNRTLTEAQLEALAKDRLARLRSEEYNIKRQVLEDYVTRTLVETAAASRGITPALFEKREIDDKILAVTDDQKRAVYEANPQQYQGRSEEEAFPQIESMLKRLRSAEARRKLMADLRAKTPVSVLLEAPRTEVAEGNGPAAGPKDAPVTIVTFSDFQCPACGAAFPTVKRLMDQYAGKARLVFRNLPLPMHAQAPKAAEAGLCAADQGRFWELHDKMFVNQKALQVPDLKRYAGEVGLDSGRFDACLDSGKHEADWKADTDAARQLGVNSTPTFFINGRLVSGAQPLQAFADVIEQELGRAVASR